MCQKNSIKCAFVLLRFFTFLQWQSKRNHACVYNVRECNFRLSFYTPATEKFIVAKFKTNIAKRHLAIDDTKKERVAVSIHCALILSETLALYKSFTYLLTYLLTYFKIVFRLQFYSCRLCRICRTTVNSSRKWNVDISGLLTSV